MQLTVNDCSDGQLYAWDSSAEKANHRQNCSLINIDYLSQQLTLSNYKVVHVERGEYLVLRVGKRLLRFTPPSLIDMPFSLAKASLTTLVFMH